MICKQIFNDFCSVFPDFQGMSLWYKFHEQLREVLLSTSNAEKKGTEAEGAAAGRKQLLLVIGNLL